MHFWVKNRFSEILKFLRICWSDRLWLKAGSGPDSAEATENTEWVRTEFTENYDFPIPGFSSVTG